MAFIGQVITMRVFNSSEALFLITLLTKCGEFKWLGLIYVDSAVEPLNNYAVGGINLQPSIPSTEIIIVFSLIHNSLMY